MWNLWPKVRASAEEDKKEKHRNKSKGTLQTWKKSWSSRAKASEKDDNAFSPTTVPIFLPKLSLASITARLNTLLRRGRAFTIRLLLQILRLQSLLILSVLPLQMHISFVFSLLVFPRADPIEHGALITNSITRALSRWNNAFLWSNLILYSDYLWWWWLNWVFTYIEDT